MQTCDKSHLGRALSVCTAHICIGHWCSQKLLCSCVTQLLADVGTAESRSHIEVVGDRALQQLGDLIQVRPFASYTQFL